jgi:hypothetical protein
MQVKAIRFGLKFKPPELAMEFRDIERDEIKLVQVRGDELFGKDDPTRSKQPEDMLAALQALHPPLFSESVISIQQVTRLLAILVDNMQDSSLNNDSKSSHEKDGEMVGTSIDLGHPAEIDRSCDKEGEHDAGVGNSSDEEDEEEEEEDEGGGAGYENDYDDDTDHDEDRDMQAAVDPLAPLRSGQEQKQGADARSVGSTVGTSLVQQEQLDENADTGSHNSYIDRGAGESESEESIEELR